MKTVATLPAMAPKARLDFDLHDTYMRMRGAKQSWRVEYSDITQMFLLPAADASTRYFVIALRRV